MYAWYSRMAVARTRDVGSKEFNFIRVEAQPSYTVYVQYYVAPASAGDVLFWSPDCNFFFVCNHVC